MTYAIITANGAFTIDPRPVSLALVTEAVGPEGWDRIPLHRGWDMAAWCNDLAYRVAADRRNISGSALLTTLGAAARPYCGTLVITGYNHGSNWGGPEDLDGARVQIVEAMHADVSVILAGGQPAQRVGVEPEWVDIIGEFMEYARTAELPRMMAEPIQ